MTVHVVKRSRNGWRCTCGTWLPTLDDAERHAHSTQGSIEPAGAA